MEQQTPPLGRCSKVDYMMMQRYNLCGEHTTAKFLLMYDDEGKQNIVQSHAYGEVVYHIAGVDDVSAEVLLRANKLDSMTLIRDFLND